MKFTCMANELAYAIDKCARMSKFKENYPQARNIVIVADADSETLRISATDVITSAVTYYVRKVNVKQGGKVVVDAKSLSVFMSSVFDEVNVYITAAGRVIFKCRAKKISLVQSTAVPIIPVRPENAQPVCSITGKLLNSVLSISFISDGEHATIPALAGVLLMFDIDNMYSMVASQGRAAYTWYSTRANGKGRFLLPLDTISLLQQYTYDSDLVDISYDGKKLWFQTGKYTLSTSQISGDFPYEYISKMVTLDKPYHVTVSREELHDALLTCFKLARVTADKRKKITFVSDVDYNLFTITTDEKDEIGDLEWPIVIRGHNGTSLKFSLPTNYLENILIALEKLSSSDLMGQLRGDDNITISVGSNPEGNLGPIFMTAPTMQALFVMATLGVPEIINKD